jgi:hypothetical protein
LSPPSHFQLDNPPDTTTLVGVFRIRTALSDTASVPTAVSLRVIARAAPVSFAREADRPIQITSRFQTQKFETPTTAYCQRLSCAPASTSVLSTRIGLRIVARDRQVAIMGELEPQSRQLGLQPG